MNDKYSLHVHLYINYIRNYIIVTEKSCELDKLILIFFRRMSCLYNSDGTFHWKKKQSKITSRPMRNNIILSSLCIGQWHQRYRFTISWSFWGNSRCFLLQLMVVISCYTGNGCVWRTHKAPVIRSADFFLLLILKTNWLCEEFF